MVRIFKGVCCCCLFENSQVITNELEPIIISMRDPSCEIDDVQEKIISLEQTLCFLDAVFSYLNIHYPTSDEKTKAREVVKALACHGRRIGLNVRLKAHIMEKMPVNSMISTGLVIKRRFH